MPAARVGRRPPDAGAAIPAAGDGTIEGLRDLSRRPDAARPRWARWIDPQPGSSPSRFAALACLLALALAAGAARAGDPRLAAAPAEEAAPAIESERLYLSGTGPEAPASWEFRIDSGRGAGGWRVIPVPANWELAGFGRYTHGKHWWRPAESAVYRTRFVTPRRFAGRRVELVFEGVMTDAEVRLNGRPVGEPHHGGFTRFAYDVSSMLFSHMPNVLEVRVSEESAEASVNRAEREADYWTFGGIYRPVYLEIHPPASITHAAVDARHDGRLAVRLETVGPVTARVRASVETLDGEPLGKPLEAALSGTTTRLEGRVEGVVPWSAESPNLYRLRLELLSPDGVVLHRRELRVGFRTVEIRAGEGLFVNERRVVLKGVNRHSHWPETGRAVPAAVNRADVELIRSLNMNAVRTAHSPPDPEFLDACDELGIYVVDELPGWHDAYDTEVGARILFEMVRRDVNHPSVILWANGNEGGWNTELDPLFGELDPQGRPVLHPGSRGLGFEASHYADWRELGRLVAEPVSARGEPPPLLLPTEILHALYDGGGGASLEDYWRLLRSSPTLGGAFLWSLFDEGVVRTDRGGRVDTSGNRGADGLLGPYREPEASAAAVREIWSPVRLAAHRFSPEALEVELENRFDETDLADCELRWRWLALPVFPEDGAAVEAAPGEALPLPAAAPGETARLALARPESLPAAVAVEVRVLAADGRELMSWVLPEAPPDPIAAAWREAARAGASRVRIDRRGDRLTLRSAGGRWARFDLDSGELVELGQGDRRLPLAGGARRADGRRASLVRVDVESRPRAVRVRAHYEGALDEVTWTFHGQGLLRLDYALRGAADDGDYLGVGFSGLAGAVRSLTWLGMGPYRVWRNRLAGGRLGVWRTTWNDSITGVDWRYPELPGIYAGVRWASLETGEGTLTLAPDPGLYLGVLEPRFAADARTAVADAPAGITVLHQIPAIGTKFHRPEALGPAARRRLPPGVHRGGVWLTFSAAAPAGR